MYVSPGVLIWSLSVLALAGYSVHKAFTYRDERDALRAQLAHTNYRKEVH